MTPYQIADATDHFYGIANTRAINRIYRQHDQSHLWPICGRFNATERAIRRTRREFAACSEPCVGLAYCLALDSALSDIVNNEV